MDMGVVERLTSINIADTHHNTAIHDEILYSPTTIGSTGIQIITVKVIAQRLGPQVRQPS
jgi:hypothetical protein